MSTLKVQEIQHTGGTTAQTIDSTGRILTPARPAFRARIAGSTGGHGDNGTLVFETEDFDIGGNYDTSNGKFTAPINGIYNVGFRAISTTNASGSANGDGEAAYVYFFKNGSVIEGTVFYHYISGITNFHATLNGNTLLQLSAGDEITVVVGGEFIYSDTNTYHDPVFEGFLIG
jgi:hypothetical protein